MVYAVEIWAVGWPQTPHPSPVKVLGVKPLKHGNGMLEVKFFHANYPSGVQIKTYQIQIQHRSPIALAGIQHESDEERLLVFFPLTMDWLRTHWPAVYRNDVELQQVLERQIPSRLQAES